MDRKRDWPGAWLLPLLVAVGYGLFVKYRLLDTPLGFSAVARLLSRVDASQLSLLERLALFRADLLLGCLVLPLAALALGWRLGRRGRLLLALGLGLVVGIAAIGVIAFRNVVERRQQIGVIRALGFRQQLVSLSFMIETAFVVLLGVLAGGGMGLMLARNLFASGDISDGVEVDFSVPWPVIMVVLAATLVAALLMTWIPARQASRISPAEALRYE